MAIRCMRHTRATQGWGSCFGIAADLKTLENVERPTCKCPECQRDSWIPEGALRTRPTERNGPMPLPATAQREVDRRAKLAKWRDETKLERTVARKYAVVMGGRVTV